MAWLYTEGCKAEGSPRETWQTQLAVLEQGAGEDQRCLVKEPMSRSRKDLQTTPFFMELAPLIGKKKESGGWPRLLTLSTGGVIFNYMHFPRPVCI